MRQSSLVNGHLPVLQKKFLISRVMNTGEQQIAEREALAVDALRSSGRLRIGVRGASMLPALWPGDVVEIVARSFAEVQPGEVVLIARAGRLFVHRIVARSGTDSFVARGDSMPQADPLYDSSALVGKIESVVRNGRTIHFPITPRHHRALGFVFGHFDLARRVALKIHNWSRSRDPQALAAPQSVEV